MVTELQQQVWGALEQIPKGKVTTYGTIAAHLNTKAVRAVASAVGKNPNAPQVPCHRVVPGTGKLGNYSGDGDVITKKKLLRAEGIVFKGDVVVNFKDVLFIFGK